MKKTNQIKIDRDKLIAAQPSIRKLLRWAWELRTTNKKQGRNYLKTMTNNYCCLGILADMHDAKWIALSKFKNVYYLGNNCSAMPNEYFMAFTDFKYYVQDSFFLANDNDQLTFKEISNEIIILCWFVFLNRIGLYKIKGIMS